MTLLRVLVPRLLATVPILVIVSLIVFAIPYFIPGDPAFIVAGPSATAADVQRVRGELGLNDPLLVAYVEWLTSAIRFDFGESFIVGRSVKTLIVERMNVTVSLAVLSTCFAAVVGIPLGLIAGSRRGSKMDRLAVGAAALGVAIPNYWLGAILVTYLAVGLGWFPASGYVEFGESPAEWARHLALPTISLGAIAAAEVTRQTRARLAEVLLKDYMKTARMKGLPPLRVLLRHAFKNAAIPVVTVLGLAMTVSLGGAVIVERIFGMAGLGGLAIDAVLSRDIPVIQGIVLFATVVAVLANLAVDIVTGYLDPRISAA